MTDQGNQEDDRVRAVTSGMVMRALSSSALLLGRNLRDRKHKRGRRQANNRQPLRKDGDSSVQDDQQQVISEHREQKNEANADATQANLSLESDDDDAFFAKMQAAYQNARIGTKGRQPSRGQHQTMENKEGEGPMPNACVLADVSVPDDDALNRLREEDEEELEKVADTALESARTSMEGAVRAAMTVKAVARTIATRAALEESEDEGMAGEDGDEGEDEDHGEDDDDDAMIGGKMGNMITGLTAFGQGQIRGSCIDPSLFKRSGYNGFIRPILPQPNTSTSHSSANLPTETGTSCPTRSTTTTTTPTTSSGSLSPSVSETSTCSHAQMSSSTFTSPSAPAPSRQPLRPPFGFPPRARDMKESDLFYGYKQPLITRQDFQLVISDNIDTQQLPTSSSPSSSSTSLSPSSTPSTLSSSSTPLDPQCPSGLLTKLHVTATSSISPCPPTSSVSSASSPSPSSPSPPSPMSLYIIEPKDGLHFDAPKLSSLHVIPYPLTTSEDNTCPPDAIPCLLPFVSSLSPPHLTSSCIIFNQGYFYNIQSLPLPTATPSSCSTSTSSRLPSIDTLAPFLTPLLPLLSSYDQAHRIYDPRLLAATRRPVGCLLTLTPPTPSLSSPSHSELSQPFISLVTLSSGECPLSLFLQGIDMLLPIIYKSVSLQRLFSSLTETPPSSLSSTSSATTSTSTLPAPTIPTAATMLPFYETPREYCNRDIASRTELPLTFTQGVYEQSPPLARPSHVSRQYDAMWRLCASALEANLPLPNPFMAIPPRFSSVLAYLMWQIGVQMGRYAKATLNHNYSTPSSSTSSSSASLTSSPLAKPLCDLFYMAAPEAVKYVAPSADILITAETLIPYNQHPQTHVNSQPSSADSREGKDDTAAPSSSILSLPSAPPSENLPPHRMFDALRYSILDSTPSSPSDHTPETNTSSLPITSLSVALRQLLVLAFDTTVSGTSDYFCPQPSLQDTCRAVINIALILIASHLSTS